MSSRISGTFIFSMGSIRIENIVFGTEFPLENTNTITVVYNDRNYVFKFDPSETTTLSFNSNTIKITVGLYYFILKSTSNSLKSGANDVYVQIIIYGSYHVVYYLVDDDINIEYYNGKFYFTTGGQPAKSFSDCILLRTLEGWSDNCLACTNESILVKGECKRKQIENCSMYDNVTGVCVKCNDGYYLDNETYSCMNCSNNCKQCENVNREIKCNECDNYYILENDQCGYKDDKCISTFNSHCIKCSDGKLDLTMKCSDCEVNGCSNCYTNDTCIKCDGLSIQVNESYCEEKESLINSNENVVQCEEGYFNDDKECKECSLLDDKCQLCSNSYCSKCEYPYLNINGKCKLPENSTISQDKITCISDEYYLDPNGLCYLKIDDCIHYQNGKCEECSNSKYLVNDTCLIVTDSNCIMNSFLGCTRCIDGYYLDKTNKCQQCNSNCRTCYDNSTFCTSCSDDKYLEDNECKSNKELQEVCNKVTNDGQGCVICKDGYYREGLICKECLSECGKCNNPNNCLTCNEEHFMTINGECKLKNLTEGCVGEISSSNGCSLCETSYYLQNKECHQCPSECSTCTSESECTSCIDEYVLVNDKCKHYKDIKNCKKSKDNKCSSCTFWHKPSKDGTTCNSHSEWRFIVFIVIFIVVIIIATIILLYFIIKKLIERKQEKKLEETTTIFKLKYTNIKFSNNITKVISTNITEIKFEDEEFNSEIKVNIETKALLCIANGTKHNVKIQITSMANDKREIRVEPDIFVLKKGEGCEFSIYIKPLCTCSDNDNDKLAIVYQVLNSTSESNQTEIKMKYKTEMSTRLDPDELIEDKKLGEGSFGIVFKGTFRGNEVAIKRMKEAADNKERKEEFDKEVSMLYKFRDPYIVHFYGAVFIPNKICMVTEFAQFGSLNDLITIMILLMSKLESRYY